MHHVAVALGSNVGDRRAHLTYAVDCLRALLAMMRVSSFVETEPVGVGSQPKFLNGAAVGDTSLAPRALLESLLTIEIARGRVRAQPGAPRTLDLDLIVYGDAVIDEPGLVVPHPRFRDREFVLAPLAEIAPEIVDPVTKRTARELLAALRP